jgi:O-succinylbenzoic acid--CoA ligase
LRKLFDTLKTKIDVKKVLLGGMEIPADLVAHAESLGIECYCGYGLTEMASTVCAKRANATHGVGTPLSGREVLVEKREILLRGAGLASGYWQEGKLVTMTDEAGWFHTRDRGEWVEGELHVLGRLDHMFISGGENVQPEDIERVLARHPHVDQAFVTSVPDTLYGARPVAVIEGEASFEGLREWVKDKLAVYQQPTSYYALPDTLKKEGIKISRRRLAAWVEERHANDASSVSKK